MGSKRKSLPLSLLDAKAFVRHYAYPKTGLMVGSRYPLSQYTHSMWDNLKNRLVIESRKAAASEIEIFREIGPVDFTEELPSDNGRRLVFDNGAGGILELLFDYEKQSVTVLLNGAVRLSSVLDDDIDRDLHHDQGWHFSMVMLGGAASGLELLTHGIGYECPGMRLPLTVFGTARADVLEFVLPDQRSFFFDGRKLTPEMPSS